jgi:hypothetical protein
MNLSQPGAKAITFGAAAWIHQLSEFSWVPCAPPGASSDSLPTLVLRPCEVSLRKSEIEMPTSRFCNEDTLLFSSASSIIQSTLKWGTVMPAPPIERFCFCY